MKKNKTIIILIAFCLIISSRTAFGFNDGNFMGRHQKRIEVNCHVCNNKYIIRPSEINKKHTCSKECEKKYRSMNEAEIIQQPML